jgi:hypothetical protein
MMTNFARAAAALALILAVPAASDDVKPLTVEQCINVLAGLKALDCAGEQLNGTCPADAKQYKLGDARLTIGMNVAALTPVLTEFQRAQQKYMMELPRVPTPEAGKPVPPEVADMRAQQDRESVANQLAMLAKPCNVQPGRLKQSELKLGDGADQNAIPPSVFAAFSPIVDK